MNRFIGYKLRLGGVTAYRIPMHENARPQETLAIESPPLKGTRARLNQQHDQNGIPAL